MTRPKCAAKRERPRQHLRLPGPFGWLKGFCLNYLTENCTVCGTGSPVTVNLKR